MKRTCLPFLGFVLGFISLPLRAQDPAAGSVRLVMDVGAWDNSVCINVPGQSGDPRSPHFADLAAPWARGDYVPLLFSRDKVDAATTHRIRLVPAGTKGVQP